MLTRYRWYRIQLPSEDFDLPSNIAGMTMTKDTGVGFSRIEGTVGASKFRFLWRTKVVMTLFDESPRLS